MKNLAIPIEIGTLTEKVWSLSFYPELLNGSIDFTVSPAKKSNLCTLFPTFFSNLLTKNLQNTSQKTAYKNIAIKIYQVNYR